ncbi:LEA type 2 family protein [Bacteroidales bacterium OttesenSCG-928-A17]|nr:LEA type 2 family protein [Bacteroidales bacterium OttesenSCG-928-A17]
MKKLFLFSLSLILFVSSCDVAQQVAGTYSMTQCKYDYSSISNLQLAGVNLQNVSSLSSLNPISAANLVAAFASSSQSLPLNFTLNLNVKNPNAQTAILNGLSYILEIDGQQMTTGYLSDQLQIATDQTAKLPIAMSFDLRTVMQGKSLEAIKNLAFNFAGIGSSSSNVTVKLQPSIKIGTQTIKSPTYIPVSFTLNK